MSNKLWVGTDSGNVGDWATSANWEPVGVPVNGDDVILASGSQNVLSGFDQSLVILNSITVDLSWIGIIGSTQADFLQIAAATAVIGQRRGSTGTFSGSKRLNLDFGSTTACQVNIYGTATSGQDQNRSPLRIRAANSSTDVNMFGGTASVSDDTSNSSTIGDVIIESGSLTVGDNVTMTGLVQSGGGFTTQSSLATMVIKGGTSNFYDGTSANTITTVTISGSGSLNHFASGLIGTINLNGGNVDLTKSQKSKTVTTITASNSGTLIIDTGVTTLTNDIALTSNEVITIGFS